MNQQRGQQGRIDAAAIGVSDWRTQAKAQATPSDSSAAFRERKAGRASGRLAWRILGQTAGGVIWRGAQAGTIQIAAGAKQAMGTRTQPRLRPGHRPWRGGVSWLSRVCTANRMRRILSHAGGLACRRNSACRAPHAGGVDAR